VWGVGDCSTHYAAGSAGDDPTELIEELTDTHQPPLARGEVCVVLAAHDTDPRLPRCVRSLQEHTPAQTPLLTVPATTVDVNRVLARLAPADVVLLSAPCLLTPGWLGRLRDAALSDTNTATASALADSDTPLALCDADLPVEDLLRLATPLAEHSLRLRPRLDRTVGPCVYLRRETLELVGSLEESLALRPALEVDFARRCLLVGLSHVAADDVLVGHLAPDQDPGADARDADACEQDAGVSDTVASTEDRDAGAGERNAGAERSDAAAEESQAATDGPGAAAEDTVAASGVLPRALRAARRPHGHLSVTIDARALGSAVTGTQRHIFELISALAATERLRLRLLVSPDCSPATVELLRSLPHTELLPIAELDAHTPRTTVFHRPQQVFEPADMRLALQLGERIVLSQLDLIAFRNPSYHASADEWHSHRRVTREALAAADRIVVFSPHTRLELLSDELLDGERVRIVPPGLDHSSPPTPPVPADAIPTPTGAPATGEQSAVDARVLEGDGAGFLLCLGTDFTHKNRLFALRLLSALREHHDWRGRLALAGTHIPHGSSRELEREYLERHPELREVVVELGTIGEPEREWLMSSAAAVLYPSVYEGFGLIPFEAALSGTPCAFAPQASLAEVLPADTATILPWDPRESAARVHTLLSDPPARERHLHAIVEAARHLTWAKAAAATVEVYEEAALAPVREAAVLAHDELWREQELRELIAAQDALVAQLDTERRHAQGMYDELNAEVGSGLSLIGPHGALPEDLQRALLALSARPALSRPLYGALARVFRLLRVLAGGASGGRRRSG
jgi:glycosyltransferase involved in cell wall biosynthesis